MEQQKEQWLDSVLEQNKKQVNRKWMYACFALAGIIALMYFSTKYNKINNDYLFYIGSFGLGGYAYYLWWLREQEPSYEKMVQVVRTEMFKMGKNLNMETNNIFIEPLGTDYFGCRIEDEMITFLLHKNKLIGSSAKRLADLQQDINKMNIQQILAKNGVIQNVD